MKRSKMINIICQILVKNIDKDCHHFNINKIDNISSNILSILEELGMEPPAILYRPKENETSHHFYYPNGFPTNRWEDEDEKK